MWYLELSSDTTFSTGATAVDHKQSSSASGNLKKDMDPNLAKIWAVYEDAKRDYHEKSDHGDGATFRAAKFLRDTAENILIQLKGQNTDEVMLEELNGTYNMAKAMVVSLSGGKKRKFDPVAMDEVKGIPRGPSNSGPSQGRSESAETREHRGRTRTQRPPTTLRRDERRYDERYSFDEGYLPDERYSFGERYAERNETGYDGRYANTDPARYAQQYPGNDDARYAQQYPSNDDAGYDQRFARTDDALYERGYDQQYAERHARSPATGPYNFRRHVDSYQPRGGH